MTHHPKHKNNELTQEEITVLNQAREKMIEAMKKRTNPAEFDSNIAYLTALADAKHWELKVAQAHRDNKNHMQEKKDKSKCFSFFKNNYKEKIAEEEAILEKMRSYVMDPLKDMMAVEMAREPRIKDLNYDVAPNQAYKKNKNIQAEFEKYKISFSDGTAMSFSDLNPIALKINKVRFDEKMKELSAINTNRSVVKARNC